MLPGFDINSIPTLQVKVWDFGLFPTFEAAQVGGAKWGQSLPFTYRVPDASIGSVAALYMEGLQAFALVPEPSQIALSVLGATGIFLFRWAKRCRAVR